MIISIGFLNGVGKTTLAKLLRLHLTNAGVTACIIPLAEQLKNTCQTMLRPYNLADVEYYDKYPNTKDKVTGYHGLTPRQIWLEFGATIASSPFRNVWIDNVIAETKNCDFVIVPDVRFRREIDAFTASGFGHYSIRLDRQGLRSASDIVELTEWQFDKRIANNGDLHDLNRKAIELCQILMTRMRG